MNISETVSWPLVQMPQASGRITVNDLNYKLGLEISDFTQNLIPGTVKSILHFIQGYVDNLIKDSGTCRISYVVLTHTHPSDVFLVWWQGADESTKAYESMLV